MVALLRAERDRARVVLDLHLHAQFFPERVDCFFEGHLFISRAG